MSEFWKTFNQGLELDEDDKSHIRELLTSRGWRVLTHKVWPKKEYDLMVHAKVNGNDDTGRFSAGLYAGIRLCQEMAEKLGKPRPERLTTPKRPRSVHLQRQNQRGSKPL